MAQSRIAGRYAKALLDLAKKNGNTEAIFQDMAYVHEAIEISRDLELLLKSPIINQDKKAAIFKELFNDKLSQTSLKFLSLILKKRRESDVGQIAFSYMHQYFNLNKVTKIKLASAHPLSKEKVDEIMAKLKKQAGLTEVEVEVVVNEDLIGGFVVEYDDKVLDASVKSSLRKIKKKFATQA